MTLLNTILLPFQAGYENIITASGKPRELSVIKRIFENNHYRYNLQLDNSLFSRQGRVSMFAKGVALCLPFIGHITSIALRFFSSSIFPEMPLEFAIKCSAEQKLAIAKQFYIDKPEGINKTVRLTLAEILAADAEGLDLLASNLSYLGLMTDVEFSLRIIQQKPEVLGPINDPQFTEQILSFLQEAPAKQKLAIAMLYYINEPEGIDKNVCLVLEEIFANDPQFAEQILNFLQEAPAKQKLAIAKKFYINKPEGIDETVRLALAEILAADAEGLDLLASNLSYLGVMTDVEFSLRIIQQKPEVLGQIKDPQFTEQIFSLLQKAPAEQKLAIAKKFYINKPEGIDETVRLALAEILAADAEGLDLLASNLSYLDLMTDVEFSLEIIERKPKVLDQTNDPQFTEQIFSLLQEAPAEQKLPTVMLIYTKSEPNDTTRMKLAEILIDTLTNSLAETFLIFFREVLEQDKTLFAKQLLQKDPQVYTFLTTFFDNLHLNEDLGKTIIKELILQTKEDQLPYNPYKRNQAIIHLLKNRTNDDFIEHLLKDNDYNIALADILLTSEEDYEVVIANIQHLDLIQNIAFSQKLLQEKNPKQNKQHFTQIKKHFTKQILQKTPIDREFIIDLFESLKLSIEMQKEFIEELLMDSFSEEMQITIAHTIIEKHPNSLNLLLSKIKSFIHTQELGNILVKTSNGKIYIKNNLDKFNLSEEQKNTLLQIAS